jgi:3,4-dihydroxy 2-butanone 4-phosphate synthase/GTP cyclohydrolase II
MGYRTSEEAISAIARGELVVVVDDTDREDEGHLIFAAEVATTDKLAFMVRHTSGVVCAALSEERVSQLRLPPMVAESHGAQRNAFTVSVDYTRGNCAGISAAGRALTLRALSDPSATSEDFARPGHVFPLRAKDGGVLRRAGHTEAASDLARLAGLRPHAVSCELLEEDGSMAERPSLLRFAQRHGLSLITIADLIGYRRRTERWVVPVSEAHLPTRHGVFVARVYRSLLDDIEHVALYMGKVEAADDLPVRVQSECITSEVFGSLRCDCRDQLDAALSSIALAQKGVLVYLRGHEGRGIGLGSKMRAYALQEQGLDTVQANLALGLPVDSRRYDVAAHILRDLSPRSIRLISNNPDKFSALESYGVTITRRVRLVSHANEYNADYLRSKQCQLGHDLDLRAFPSFGQEETPR